MRREMACVFALFVVAVFLTSISAHAQPGNPQEALRQYVADLQKSPNDYALREKIIRPVQGMKPEPGEPGRCRVILSNANPQNI